MPKAADTSSLTYYVIEDERLQNQIRLVVDAQRDVLVRLTDFVSAVVPSAIGPRNIAYEGNLQIYVKGFDYLFENKKKIPDNEFAYLMFTDLGIYAIPDVKTTKGAVLFKEQRDMLEDITNAANCAWGQRAKTIFRWESNMEPGLVVNEDKKVYVMIVVGASAMGPFGYQPPKGMREVDQNYVIRMCADA